MANVVEVESGIRLDDYAAVAHLSPGVADLRVDAARLTPALHGRTIWMINSTPQGGGVAELLPPLITLFRELGVDTRWAVMDVERADFFALTKRIHNMIHGREEGALGPGDREAYDEVSRSNASALLRIIRSEDILVVHDPQPLGVGAIVKRELGIRVIWRCHIGLDEKLPATSAAWAFLEPYTAPYDRVVFSAPEYVPDYLAGRASIIHPAIDPLSHKNRDLSLHKLVGILCDSALAVAHWPLVAPPFPDPVQRLQPDGSFGPAVLPEDIGLLARPVVTQVSRWDRLKGFEPLLEAFRRLKLERAARPVRDERHRRRLDIVRLVLAGPDPGSIQDDPEALEVLEELRRRYMALEAEVRRDVAVLTLPMRSRKLNSLTVNALQRASTIVVQNSLREGFGLTATEAMWKGKPVLANTRAAGLRLQIRDGLDGRLINDPEDADALAAAMHQMLADSDLLDAWGHSAQRRAHDFFLIFSQLRRWLRLLTQLD